MRDPSRFLANLNAARGGCDEALGRLLEGYRQYLLLVANRELSPVVQTKLAPSDLVQETFLEAHHSFVDFAGTDPNELGRWLRRLLLNNLRDAARRFRRTQKSALCREVRLEGRGRGELPAVADTPQRLALKKERLELVESALARLPNDQQQAIILRNLQLLPFAEVGLRLNRSSEAARKLWSRAIRTLQAELAHGDD